MPLIPKQFIDSVVSIGVMKNDDLRWIGTGFFVTKKLAEDKFQPFLVSNKHVFRNTDTIYIRLKQRETGELKIFTIPLFVDGKKEYSEHEDEQVDIAVILINGSIIMKEKLNFAFFDIDNNTFTSDEFLNEGGNEGSSVYMLGFPMGLVDINSTSPICRMGCIARFDQSEIAETKNVLLDIQNFPGNSGSPIVLKPELASLEGTKPITRAALIGIIHSYIPYQETLINSQTGRTVEIRSENSGIAKANPVEYIKEVVEMEFIKHYPDGFIE